MTAMCMSHTGDITRSVHVMQQQRGSYDRPGAGDGARRVLCRKMVRIRSQRTRMSLVTIGPIRVSRTMHVLADAFSLVDITPAAASQIRRRFLQHMAFTWDGDYVDPAEEDAVQHALSRMFVGHPGVYERAIFGPDLIADAAVIVNRATGDMPVVVSADSMRVRRFIRRIAAIITRPMDA